MAVEPKGTSRPLIKAYWPKYRNTAVMVTLGMQTLIVICVAMSLLIAGFSSTSAAFWIVLIATSASTFSLNYILVMNLLIPLKDLAAALTHVSGEPSDVVPPNPNAKHFERDGFKPLLQYIYQSAAEAGGPVERQSSSLSDDTTRLKQAFDQTSAGIVVLDSMGQIQFANKHAPVTRTTDNSLVLELLFEKEGELTQWLKDCHDTAVHAEKSWLHIPSKIVGDEDRRIFDITATYEKGSAAEIVMVMFDRTDIYQPEDDELDFIAFAAHELRGPITVIRGYLDVLDIELGASLQPDQAELIKRLIVSANRLSGYINNILNASKFDRRHMKIHLAEDSLAAIYDTISDDMRMRAQSQRRLLSVTLPQDLPTVAADRSSLSEVMANLIDNALKYSNEGGVVTLGAAVEGNFVNVWVEDHGIGIPASIVGNLFHKFYRSHRSRETVAGTGIGLYICKAIVESHGGTIGVKSSEGQGSVFTFTVPIYASVADKLQANDHTNASLINSGSGWIKNHSMYKG
ncbi:MAG: PAS domain-containing sensor histidine kinase [Candidatus Saccharimonas aalborgensis]